MTELNLGRDRALAATRRELAEFEAMDALCEPSNVREADDLTASNAPTPGGRRRRDRPGATSYSAVLSVRLEYDLLEALERRAALAGLAPSSMARNLIRYGIVYDDAMTSELLDELETVTARLRAVAR